MSYASPFAAIPAAQLSLADRLRRLPRSRREALYRQLDTLGPEAIASLRWEWEGFFARPDQIVDRSAPWRLVVFAGPRGDGKTEAAIHLWTREIVEGRAALPRFFCATEHDLDKLVEKRIRPSLPPHLRPEWESTAKVLVFRNGITAQGYAAAAPESCVGDEGDVDLYDDIAKWGPKGPMAWKHARTSCRKGLGRGIVATTRRGVTHLKKLLAGEAAEIRRAPYPFANRYNLAPGYLEQLKRELGGDDFWLQELEDEDISASSPFGGIELEDAPVRILELDRGSLDEVIVAVDPSDGKGGDHDEWGIGAAARRMDRHVVILEDGSGSYDDDEGAEKALDLCARWGATKIVVEQNRGPRVMNAIRAAWYRRLAQALARGKHLAGAIPEILGVTARDGKKLRAGPVRPLYLSGLVHHLPGMRALEKQMREWDPDGPKRPRQDDRIDWLVHALHHLAGLGRETDTWRAAPEKEPAPVAAADPWRYQPVAVPEADPYRYT